MRSNRHEIDTGNHRADCRSRAAGGVKAKPNETEKSAAKRQCKAERGQSRATGEAFKARYHSFGRCARHNAAEEEADSEAAHKNAAKQCKAERSDSSFAAARENKTFEQFYGTNKNGKNAYGKCVSKRPRSRRPRWTPRTNKRHTSSRTPQQSAPPNGTRSESRRSPRSTAPIATSATPSASAWRANPSAGPLSRLRRDWRRTVRPPCDHRIPAGRYCVQPLAALRASSYVGHRCRELSWAAAVGNAKAKVTATQTRPTQKDGLVSGNSAPAIAHTGKETQGGHGLRR
jgi:hypothetical protein